MQITDVSKAQRCIERAERAEKLTEKELIKKLRQIDAGKKDKRNYE